MDHLQLAVYFEIKIPEAFKVSQENKWLDNILRVYYNDYKV